MPRRPERGAANSPIDEAADRREALSLVPVSRETEGRLAVYVDRLKRWQAIKNLVGGSTLQHVWTRHIADSAQLQALAPRARRWVDLGSGAGFPGLVIAILLADTPDARVELIESNARKCAFLREVARETGAPAVIHAGRIEAVLDALPGPVDVVTSRALAPLDELLVLARPVLDRGALGLFMTGASDGPGSSAPASAAWTIDTAPSKTQPGARIVVVRRSASWDNSL